MITAQVQGWAELSRSMKALGPKIALRGIRSALGSGAKVVKQAAMSMAPQDTGRLRSAIYVKRLSKPNPLAERFILGVRHGRGTWKKLGNGFDKSKDAFYWKFHEFGTKYMPAHPFIVPAFEAKKEAALAKIKEVLTRKVAQIVREK
jgi:HK97 gp10 family phage protein